jgi:hypothetical protein
MDIKLNRDNVIFYRSHLDVRKRHYLLERKSHYIYELPMSNSSWIIIRVRIVKRDVKVDLLIRLKIMRYLFICYVVKWLICLAINE